MNLEIFKKDEFEIRVVNINNEPWFVAKDVAKILGYTKLDAMYRVVDVMDKRNIDPQNPEFTGFPQNGSTLLEPNPNIRIMTIINESGLYQAIFNSTLPKARDFRLWVTSEVLPTIRKHGAYLSDSKIEEILTDPDTLIKLATDLKNEREKRKALELEAKENAPYVAFAKVAEASKTSCLIGHFAKILAEKDIKIGEKKLFKWLRENKYLTKTKFGDNIPYQVYINNGYFEVIPRIIPRTEGSQERFTTYITTLGQVKLSAKIKQSF